MREVKLDILIKDGYIYPRSQMSNKTKETYVDAMLAGAEFPPIEIQRVTGWVDEEGEIHEGETLLIIDGVHRHSAYQERNKRNGEKPIETVEVIEWQEKAIDYRTHKIELALEAVERNTRHGDRVKDGDKKSQVRQIAQDDPEAKWSGEVLGAKFGVAQKTISNWISDIRTRQRAGRNAQIVRLDALGWTQNEIADVAELSQRQVSEISGNSNFSKIANFLEEGRDMAYIADYYSIDLALVWAIRLKGMTDQEKFKALDWGLRTWDDWRFNTCDERFGDDWPGRIPAQLIAHALFYFTQQGDLVLDPMAGGGVVPDVCLAFERKCRAFDLATRPQRPEIQAHYWTSGSVEWPALKKKPDLIFFDPPYFSKKAAEYEAKAENTQVPLSSLSRDDYLQFFADFLALALENSKKGTRIAFLNADWRNFQKTPAVDEKPDDAITIFDYHRLLTETGWKVTHRIECPMSSQRFNAGVVAAMQKKRILGTVGRTLLIAREM